MRVSIYATTLGTTDFSSTWQAVSPAIEPSTTRIACTLSVLGPCVWTLAISERRVPPLIPALALLIGPAEREVPVARVPGPSIKNSPIRPFLERSSVRRAFSLASSGGI